MITPLARWQRHKINSFRSFFFTFVKSYYVMSPPLSLHDYTWIMMMKRELHTTACIFGAECGRNCRCESWSGHRWITLTPIRPVTHLMALELSFNTLFFRICYFCRLLVDYRKKSTCYDLFRQLRLFSSLLFVLKAIGFNWLSHLALPVSDAYSVANHFKDVNHFGAAKKSLVNSRKLFGLL